MSPKHKILTILALVLFLAASQHLGASCAPAAELRIEGKYASAGGGSTLEVKKEGDRYVMLLSGGSQEGMDAGTPADCYVRAVGTLRGNRLEGNFAAVETDTFSYSQTQAAREKRKLEIVFSPNAAEVIRADTWSYCGMGAGFVGRYRRPPAQH